MIYGHDRDSDGDRIYDEPGETETFLVSRDSFGGLPNRESDDPTISGDGSWYAFASRATNLVATNPSRKNWDIYAFSRTFKTRRMSIATDGTPGVGDSRHPSMSYDAHFVVFDSNAPNLTEADRVLEDQHTKNGTIIDVFVHDRDSDGNSATNYDEPGHYRTYRVSVGPTDPNANLSYSISNGDSFSPAISRDGTKIAFASLATNLLPDIPDDPSGLVPRDTNQSPDIYLRDLTRRINTLVSVATDGTSAAGGSTAPIVSDDGSYVTFTSASSNLVGDDVNSASDIFLRDLTSGVTELISVTSNGAQKVTRSGASFEAAMTADGGSVIFTSAADLQGDAGGDYPQVFINNRFACVTGHPESGPVSGPVHNGLEPAAGPARAQLHDANCNEVAANGL